MPSIHTIPTWFFFIKAIFSAVCALIMMYGMGALLRQKWEQAMPKVPSSAEKAVALAIFAYLFIIFYML